LRVSETSRRQLSHNRLHSSEVTCVSNSDCEYGLFLECHPESHLCVPIQQSCPNSCSGHGNCVFRSKYHRNTTVEECDVLDVNCVPVCECAGGFMGSSCSRSESDFMEDRDIRGLLLGAISEMMSLENPDPSSVTSWLTMLRSLSPTSTGDYSGLDDDSKLLLGKLCESLLLVSFDLGLSPEDLSGIEDVMDAIFSITASSSFEASRSLSQVTDSLHLSNSLVDLYSRVTIGDMLEGQDAVKVIAPLFRMSSHSLSSPASSELTSPLTLLESLSEQAYSTTSPASLRRKQSIRLPSSLTSPLQISLVDRESFNSANPGDLWNASALSNSFGGVLTGFLCDPLSADCVFQIELSHHLSPTEGSGPNLNDVEDEYFEADCTLGTIQDHHFTCSNDREIILRCDGTRSGILHQDCPVLTPSAVCK
jgi:hypothetical protein